MTRNKCWAYLLALTIVVSPNAIAAEWVVAWRANQACYVGELPLADMTRKVYPQDISKGHPNKEVACTAAKSLKTDGTDPTEKKCFTYSTESSRLCSSAGVPL